MFIILVQLSRLRGFLLHFIQSGHCSHNKSAGSEYGSISLGAKAPLILAHVKKNMQKKYKEKVSELNDFVKVVR